MSYILDSDTKCRRMTEKQLHRWYNRHVDHNLYGNYEDWKWEMIRYGIICEIYR